LIQLLAGLTFSQGCAEPAELENRIGLALLPLGTPKTVAS